MGLMAREGVHVFTGHQHSTVMKLLIGFPVTLICLTLNDLEEPFYVKICFYRRFDYIFLPRFQRQLCENE